MNLQHALPPESHQWAANIHVNPDLTRGEVLSLDCFFAFAVLLGAFVFFNAANAYTRQRLGWKCFWCKETWVGRGCGCIRTDRHVGRGRVGGGPLLPGREAPASRQTLAQDVPEGARARRREVGVVLPLQERRLPHRPARLHGEPQEGDLPMTEQVKVTCTLCRKEKNSPKQTYSANGIHSWQHRGVCPDCVSIWEIGKKTMAASKVDGKDSEARVQIEVPAHLLTKMGDPLGPTQVRGKDVMTALGGVSLRGTEIGSRWHGGKKDIVNISETQDDRDTSHIGGGTLNFKVPKARAEAMKRVFAAFYNIVAKARVDGFNEGRNLLLGLSKGEVSLESYSQQTDNARAGKKPKKRWDE